MIRVLKIVLIALVLLRAGFDLKTYFFGSTITVPAATDRGFDYLLHLPQGYHDWSEPRPLLIFLHGSGEAGQNVRILKNHDPYRFANGKIPSEEFPFLVVSPMSPGGVWAPDDVVAFLDQILEDKQIRYRIDPSRIYLTGISMGGYGTFHVAQRFPDRFAAIVPLAGGFPPKYADDLRSVPCWAFHGNEDDVVPMENSEQIVKAIKETGNSDAKLTILPGVGHDITEDVYSRPELYRWLLEHRITP